MASTPSRHRRRTFAAVAIASSLLLTACGGAGTTSPGSKPDSATASVAAQTSGTVLIMNQPAGNPFADIVFSGLQKLGTETGVKAQQIPGVQAGAYDQQLRTAAQNGFNPVMVLWDDLGNAVAKVAPDFPNTKFIIVDSAVDPGLANVQTVKIDSIQSAYLAGVVAAHLTSTKKLGFVGGQDMGVVNDWKCGFEQGAKSQEPAITLTTIYAGTFTDPQKGQQIAASMAGDGIDVILQAANQTGLGVLTGASDNGIMGIGADVWQGDVAKSVPWSALKDAGTAAYLAAKNVLDDKFTSGLWTFDATQGAPLYDQRDLNALKPQVQTIVKEVEAKLADGSVAPKCK